jgi:hypothetical protein
MSKHALRRAVAVHFFLDLIERCTKSFAILFRHLRHRSGHGVNHVHRLGLKRLPPRIL